MFHYDFYCHSQGPLPFVQREGAFVYIGFFHESLDAVQSFLDPEGKEDWQAKALPDGQAALARYFEGERLVAPYELVEGTAFQRAVWQALTSIEWGKTVSYKELAQRLGRPQAVRAVANAVGRNPLAILIPCHRVIGHRGDLGGYRGGRAMKRYLLNLEGVELN